MSFTLLGDNAAVSAFENATEEWRSFFYPLFSFPRAGGNAPPFITERKA